MHIALGFPSRPGRWTASTGRRVAILPRIHGANPLGVVRLAILLVFVVASCATGGRAFPAGDDAAAPGPSQEAQLKEFAPGVRIDWAKRLVEVDAKVVLREGPLELFACSPQTREHESILSVVGRPMHIFQAMGLIGLEPGSPVRFDEKRARWFAPTGRRLDLRVRFRRDDTTRTVPVERWLRDVQRARPPENVRWVLAGSKTFESGRFGADVDGTVICVVDFETALITVGTLRSADNEVLWLEANTEEIPPVGTSCTILIAGAKRRLHLVVMPNGTVRRSGRVVSPAEVLGLARLEGTGAGDTIIVLRAADTVSEETAKSVVESLVRKGINRECVEVLRVEPAANRSVPPE